MQLNFSHIRRTLRPSRLFHKHIGQRQTGPIGLEFGHSQLCLVQLETGRQGIRVRGAVSQPLAVEREVLFAESGRLKASLQSALSQSAFKGRRVVTCLPPDRMKLLMLRYQVPEGGNEALAVMQQAMDQVDGGMDDWVVDYMPLRLSTPEAVDRSSLVALARKDSVQAYLEQLRLAGLDVQALEIGPVAIRRLIVSMQQQQDHVVNSLVVNLGLNNTFLTVLSGRRLTLDRDIEFAELALISKLAKVLEIDQQRARRMLYQHGFHSQEQKPQTTDKVPPPPSPDNQITDTLAEILKPEFRQLTDEINKVMGYIASQSHGSSIDIVYLLGGIARWPGIEEVLGALLELPVHVLNPLAQFKSVAGDVPGNGNDSQEHIAGATYALATGCALRGLIEQ